MVRMHALERARLALKLLIFVLKPHGLRLFYKTDGSVFAPMPTHQLTVYRPYAEILQL